MPLAIALYFMMWWILFLVVLPFGVKAQHEEGEVVPGSSESAPVKPNMLKKVVANTLLTSVLFAGLYAFFETGMARDMLPMVDQFIFPKSS
nr:DUF1467 family protein [Pseudovibrio flavus]